MSTLDPFINSADGVSEPYKNAFAINKLDLITGDVELPFVSSALYFGGPVHNLKVSFVGGAEVELAYVKAGTLLPIRITKILHQAYYEGADEQSSVLPHGLVALW